jgi:hypothetical protein
MPPEASSNVDYATAASPTADTRQDIWSMTPEEAGAVLAERAANFHPRAPIAPENARDADLRLQELASDVDWYRKLTSGNMEVRAEFDRLTALKNAAPTEDMSSEQIFDTTTGDTGLTRSNLISAAEDMRAEQVFNDKGIEFILSDQKFAPEAVRDAQFWLPQLERDETALYPDLPDDWPHEQQVKFLRTIVTVGDGSRP